jgi:tRNA threonylcarbamoyladenosine biosynthesis protein TsaB
MPDSRLLIETSGRVGQVGLAVDGVIVAERRLDESRRHARDLAAVSAALLAEAGIAPRSVNGVVVSIGPGSFTGLRVGIMSAKAFAYATGCELIAVPTFEAIANRAPKDITVDVISDGLKRTIYVQRFQVSTTGIYTINELKIVSLDDWLATLPADVCITGPGVAIYDELIPPKQPRMAESDRLPTVRTLFDASRVTPPLDRAAMIALEPIYLRGSSAEEKAKQIN